MPKSKVVETGFAVVYPVEGAFLAGVPAVPTIAPDAVAARLVATGAFRHEAPEIPDGETPEIAVEPLPESALAALGFYAPTEA